MSLPIIFLKPDSDAAREALSQALQPIPPWVPVPALALKVVITPEGEEKLVNFEYIDSDLLRSLLVAWTPVKKEPSAASSKES